MQKGISGSECLVPVFPAAACLLPGCVAPLQAQVCTLAPESGCRARAEGLSLPRHFFAGALRQPHAHLGQSKLPCPLALWLMGAPGTCWGSRSYGRAAAVPWASSLSALGWANQGPAARMGWACSFQRMTRAAGPGGQGPPSSPAGRRLHLTLVPRCLLPSSSRSRGEGPCLWNLPSRLGVVLMCRLVCTGGLGGERSFFLSCFCPSVRCFQRLWLTQWRRNHRPLMNELCKQGKLPSLGSPRVPPREVCPRPSTHR